MSEFDLYKLPNSDERPPLDILLQDHRSAHIEDRRSAERVTLAETCGATVGILDTYAQ